MGRHGNPCFHLYLNYEQRLFFQPVEGEPHWKREYRETEGVLIDLFLLQ